MCIYYVSRMSASLSTTAVCSVWSRRSHNVECCWAAQVPEDAEAKASAVTEQYADALKREYGALETQLSVVLAKSSASAPEQVLSYDSAAKLLTLLLTLPHGVIKYSHTVPGTRSSTAALIVWDKPAWCSIPSSIAGMLHSICLPHLGIRCISSRT